MSMNYSQKECNNWLCKSVKYEIVGMDLEWVSMNLNEYEWNWTRMAEYKQIWKSIKWAWMSMTEYEWIWTVMN